MVYNDSPVKIDLFAVQGDIIDMDFYINEYLPVVSKGYYIQLNTAPVLGTPFVMQSLRMQVRRKDGVKIKDWISGVSPADITIPGAGRFNLNDYTGFLESGHFDYSLECNNGLGWFTIMRGSWFVEKDITI